MHLSYALELCCLQGHSFQFIFLFCHRVWNLACKLCERFWFITSKWMKLGALNVTLRSSIQTDVFIAERLRDLLIKVLSRPLLCFSSSLYVTAFSVDFFFFYNLLWSRQITGNTESTSYWKLLPAKAMRFIDAKQKYVNKNRILSNVAGKYLELTFTWWREIVICGRRGEHIQNPLLFPAMHG